MVKQHLRKVHEYAYTGPKRQKNSFIGRLWITRINAASRELADMSYSQFIQGLKKANVELDRKVLADMAVHHPDQFTELANLAKSSLSA